MLGAFLILVILWVIFATVLDGRDSHKQKLLSDMRDTYSKEETLDLAYRMKHSTIVLYLAYGFMIGVATAGYLMRR